MADDHSVAPSQDAEESELLRAALDAAEVMAVVVELLDDDFRYVAANCSAADFHQRPDLVGLTAREVGLAEAVIQARLADFHECLASQKPRTRDLRFEGPAGRPGWYRLTASPLPAAAEQAPRVSCLMFDITEHRQAQEDAERQRARLALALEATRLGLWEYDLASDVVEWDERMRVLFGVEPDAPIDYDTYARCIHPDDLAAAVTTYEAALQGAHGGVYEVQHRTWARDGSLRWVRGVGQVIYGADGEPRRVIGTARDVTAEVAAAERQDLLLAELSHRVKNNLAAVQAIANHTLRSAGDDPAAFRRAFEGRLQSMARSHDLITRNGWEHADLGEVLNAALAPFAHAAIRVLGSDRQVRAKPDLAVNLVLVLNELATNAAKYGALSTAAGEVTIEWGVDRKGLTLTWRERGGPPVQPPQEAGFGSRLTHSALRTFGGRANLAFLPQGVECVLWIPLSEDLVAAP
jgi:PAS domain S-box-containing protein